MSNEIDDLDDFEGLLRPKSNAHFNKRLNGQRFQRHITEVRLKKQAEASRLRLSDAPVTLLKLKFLEGKD